MRARTALRWTLGDRGAAEVDVELHVDRRPRGPRRPASGTRRPRGRERERCGSKRPRPTTITLTIEPTTALTPSWQARLPELLDLTHAVDRRTRRGAALARDARRSSRSALVEPGWPPVHLPVAIAPRRRKRARATMGLHCSGRPQRSPRGGRPERVPRTCQRQFAGGVSGRASTAWPSSSGSS